MWVPLLSSYYASLGDLIHVPGLGHRHLHPQSLLTGPTSPSFDLAFCHGGQGDINSFCSLGRPPK